MSANSQKTVYIVHNIWGPYFKNYGLARYRVCQDIVNNMTKGRYNCKLVPVINFGESSIASRSRILYKQLSETYQNDKDRPEKVDIIACGLSGLDLRNSWHENTNLDNIINNAITLGTPHKGSLLAGMYNKGQINIDDLGTATNFLGVRPESFKEVNVQNMELFNSYLEDWKLQRSIYSVGGDRIIKNIHKSLLFSAKTLADARRSVFDVRDYDGIFYTDETVFDTADLAKDDPEYRSYHLGNMDTDHLDLIGLGLRSSNKSGIHFAITALENLESMSNEQKGLDN